MTKVTILGEEPKEVKLKPIEFVGHITDQFEISNVFDKPSDWSNIVLICKKYRGSDLDLMFCYGDDTNDCVIHTGHFNDGIV